MGMKLIMGVGGEGGRVEGRFGLRFGAGRAGLVAASLRSGWPVRHTALRPQVTSHTSPGISKASPTPPHLEISTST